MITAHTAFPMPRADLDRLRLTQILSPAFPIGTFAHSQGLEWAIAEGGITSATALRDWIEAILRFGSGRADAVFLSMARRPDAELRELADLYQAFLPAMGRATEAYELGRGFQTLTAPNAAVLPYVLALGRETSRLALPEPEVLALFLQSLAAQLLSVAVRFMPLGQAQAQRLLSDLAPAIAETADACTGAGLAALGTFTPGADLAAMAHETMETRIFRT
jgi:urease accessory protein